MIRYEMQDWVSVLVVGSSGTGKSYTVAQYLRGKRFPFLPSLQSWDLIWVFDVTGTFREYLPSYFHIWNGEKKRWKYMSIWTPSETIARKFWEELKRFDGKKLLIVDDMAAMRAEKGNIPFREIAWARNFGVSWIMTTQRVRRIPPEAVHAAQVLVVFPYRRISDLRELLNTEDIRKVQALKGKGKYLYFNI